MTWVVSIPESSSKNHQQLVYINIAWRWISRNLRARVSSSSESFRAPCSWKNLRRESRESRSGLRHSWFHSGRPPELQPQLLRHRSIPCTQLQEVDSVISTS